MFKFIFTMGLPGAGKSSVARERHPDAAFIDPDLVKECHPDYDPENPAALHAWSKAVTDAEFANALAKRDGLYVVDGTGTNTDALVQKIRAAQAAGAEVALLMVAVSLETALARNTTRSRKVPEEIVRAKGETIWTAFEIVAHYVDTDCVSVVWND